MNCWNDDLSQVKVDYDANTETFEWSISYIFGSCDENGKHVYLAGTETLVTTFKKDQCRFDPQR